MFSKLAHLAVEVERNLGETVNDAAALPSFLCAVGAWVMDFNPLAKRNV
jgi:hypothetical protein